MAAQLQSSLMQERSRRISGIKHVHTQDALRAHRDRLDYVASLTDPQVEQHRERSLFLRAEHPRRRSDLLQRRERRNRVVNLPSTCPLHVMSDVRRPLSAVKRTMIGHDDAVHARVHRRMCILHRLHALHHERPIPVLAQDRKVLPRPELPRCHLLQPPAAKLHRFHRLLVDRRDLLAERLLVEREGWALVRPHWDTCALHEDWVRRSDLGADRCC
jgi:hypothetical protein